MGRGDFGGRVLVLVLLLATHPNAMCFPHGSGQEKTQNTHQTLGPISLLQVTFNLVMWGIFFFHFCAF